MTKILNSFRQNQCSSTVELVQWNEIRINGHFNEVDEQVFYSSLSIIPWHQITSIDIPQLFNRTFLHRLISQLTNLRKLKLEYLDRTYSHSYCKDETLLNILNDCSLCAMLMANGLRQLVLSVEKAAFTSTSIEIANLIVQRLCHLEIVTLDGFSDQLLQMTPILLNGLRKLSFFTFIGNIEENQINEKKLHDLQHSITRSFRTAVRNTFRENNQVLIWL